MDLFDDPFHCIALLAYVEVSQKYQDHPPANEVRDLAYRNYERREG